MTTRPLVVVFGAGSASLALALAVPTSAFACDGDRSSTRVVIRADRDVKIHDVNAKDEDDASNEGKHIAIVRHVDVKRVDVEHADIDKSKTVTIVKLKDEAESERSERPMTLTTHIFGVTVRKVTAPTVASLSVVNTITNTLNNTINNTTTNNFFTTATNSLTTGISSPVTTASVSKSTESSTSKTTTSPSTSWAATLALPTIAHTTASKRTVLASKVSPTLVGDYRLAATSPGNVASSGGRFGVPLVLPFTGANRIADIIIVAALSIGAGSYIVRHSKKASLS